MDVTLKTAGKTLVVRMKGELDHHAADSLRGKIDERIHNGQVVNVLFNFQAVNFMDSSGLGMLLGRYKQVKEKGGRVFACSLPPAVGRLFEISGLAGRIPVFDSEQEALKGA